MLSKMPQQAIEFLGLSIGLAIITASIPAFAQAADKKDLAIAEATPTAPVMQANNSGDVIFIQPKSTQVRPATGDQRQPSIQPNAVSDSQVQALQKLNDRYNCGITNSTTAISRSEFSKKVGVCLTALEIKMAQEPEAVTNNEDLLALQELVSAFRDEINSLANDLSITNDRITESAFSTTTKLVGEVIIGFNGFGGAPAPNTSNTTLTDRVRLNFDTTFTGKDRLRTRLQARNTTPFGTTVTGTNTTRLGFDGNDGDNASFLSLLKYNTPISDQASIIVETVGSEFNENMYTFNPQLTSAGSGSISRFGRYNPVYRQSADGASIGLEYKFDKQLSANIGYAIPGTTAANPNAGNGFFNGSNALIGQVRYQAAPGIDLGLVYARSYHTGGTGVTGSTGTAFANNPFNGARTTADHYNFLASAQIARGFILSGWAGITNARNSINGTDSADLFNFAVSAAFTDLGARGNTLAFILGAPPKVTSNTVAARRDTANPLHLETFYKIRVSDALDVTPGLLIITNPDTTTRNTEYVGTIRTTLKF